jgi:hypothetical protein
MDVVRYPCLAWVKQPVRANGETAPAIGCPCASEAHRGRAPPPRDRRQWTDVRHARGPGVDNTRRTWHLMARASRQERRVRQSLLPNFVHPGWLPALNPRPLLTARALGMCGEIHGSATAGVPDVRLCSGASRGGSMGSTAGPARRHPGCHLTSLGLAHTSHPRKRVAERTTCSAERQHAGENALSSTPDPLAVGALASTIRRRGGASDPGGPGRDHRPPDHTSAPTRVLSSFCTPPRRHARHRSARRRFGGSSDGGRPLRDSILT